MAYTIRNYRDDDTEALRALTLAAIETIGSKAYSAEQVEAWSAGHRNADRIRERVAAGVWIFVAADLADHPVAFALLEPPFEGSAHLDMLYCHPDHTRHGLADQLLARAENFGHANGAKRLYSEASELARSAFERAGYTMTHRRDFAILHEGREVPIHNYAMEKLLG